MLSNARVPYAGVPVGQEHSFDESREAVIQNSLTELRKLQKSMDCEWVGALFEGLKKVITGPILVTGSSGLLGRMLVLSLLELGFQAVGVDVHRLDDLVPRSTDYLGSVEDVEMLKKAMVHSNGQPCQSILHTAALHAPNAKMFSEEDFQSVNVFGTKQVLSVAKAQNIRGIVFVSTTSQMASDAVREEESQHHVVLGEEPLGENAEIDRQEAQLDPIGTKRPQLAPRNKYGTSKLLAEQACRESVRESIDTQNPFSVFSVRCSRFFVEEAFRANQSDAKVSNENWKANELLSGTRASLLDMCLVNLAALKHVLTTGKPVYEVALVASPSPLLEYGEEHVGNSTVLEQLQRYSPDLATKVAKVYGELRWSLPERIKRTYVSDRVRRILGWTPQLSFTKYVELLEGELQKYPGEAVLKQFTNYLF